MNSLWRILLLCLLSAVTAYPQTQSNGNGNGSGSPIAAIDYETIRLEKIVTAVRTTERIILDGRLDEPAWKLASPATDFITKLPRPGEPSEERTEVRFVYDDDILYVGFICFASTTPPTMLLF